MEHDDALAKITEIHSHLARSGIYKGYRSLYVGISGIIGIGAGALESFFVPVVASKLFVFYWLIIAGINLSMCALMMGYQYIFQESKLERRKTMFVLAQFVPMLVAGIIVTVPIYTAAESAIPFLPGLWALLFGMGIFALRPYLPLITAIAGAFYFVCSFLLFGMAVKNPALLGYGLGCTFGIGQVLSAVLLFFSIERKNNGKK